jgi:hypothetical protein
MKIAADRISSVYKSVIPNLNDFVATIRYNDEGRARSEHFQHYPGGKGPNWIPAFVGMMLDAFPKWNRSIQL